MNHHRISLFGVIAVFLSVLIACNSPSAKLSAQAQDKGVSDSAAHFLKFKNGLRAIHQDRHGNFWFGSHNEGAAMYNGSTLRYYSTADGLSDMQIRSIAEDPAGGIWFEGGKGLSRFMNGMIQTVTQRDHGQKEQWASHPSDLWFKGDEAVGYNGQESDPGVNRYDGSTLQYHTFPFSKGMGPRSEFSVSTPAVKAKDGTVWFGTYGAVFGYAKGEFTVITDKTLGLNDSTGHLHVRSLFDDSKGALWIGNNGIGLIRFDGENFVNVSQTHGLVAPESTHNGSQSPPGTLEHVFAIGEDAEGNLWFGDRDTGVWRFNGTRFINYTEADGLTTSHVWSIYRDRQNRLLFAMGDGAVCRWTGQRFVREW